MKNFYKFIKIFCKKLQNNKNEEEEKIKELKKQLICLYSLKSTYGHKTLSTVITSLESILDYYIKKKK